MFLLIALVLRLFLPYFIILPDHLRMYVTIAWKDDLGPINCILVFFYENQRGYFDIGIVDTTGLMILTNVLSSFLASCSSVQISP